MWQISQKGVAVDGDDQSGLMSPLPFESSLAPDFLALFANWESDWEN